MNSKFHKFIDNDVIAMMRSLHKDIANSLHHLILLLSLLYAKIIINLKYCIISFDNQIIVILNVL